jgi:hypothetical protein
MKLCVHKIGLLRHSKMLLRNSNINSSSSSFSNNKLSFIIVIESKIASKQFVLFHFVMFNSPKPWHFMPHTWYLWKALNVSMSMGVMTWFENVWSYGAEAIDCLNYFSLKIK